MQIDFSTADLSLNLRERSIIVGWYVLSKRYAWLSRYRTDIPGEAHQDFEHALGWIKLTIFDSMLGQLAVWFPTLPGEDLEY